jgi:hypothetical protein
MWLRCAEQNNEGNYYLSRALIFLCSKRVALCILHLAIFFAPKSTFRAMARNHMLERWSAPYIVRALLLREEKGFKADRLCLVMTAPELTDSDIISDALDAWREVVLVVSPVIWKTATEIRKGWDPMKPASPSSRATNQTWDRECVYAMRNASKAPTRSGWVMGLLTMAARCSLTEAERLSELWKTLLRRPGLSIELEVPAGVVVLVGVWPVPPDITRQNLTSFVVCPASQHAYAAASLRRAAVNSMDKHAFVMLFTGPHELLPREMEWTVVGGPLQPIASTSFPGFHHAAEHRKGSEFHYLKQPILSFAPPLKSAVATIVASPSSIKKQKDHLRKEKQKKTEASLAASRLSMSAHFQGRTPLVNYDEAHSQ